MSRTCWNLQNFILTQFAETRCRGPHLASICVPRVRFLPILKRSNLYIVSSYFRPSERDGAVLFFVGGLLLKKYSVGPAFAPESSVAHILASRPPNDPCGLALNPLQTIEWCASS